MSSLQMYSVWINNHVESVVPIDIISSYGPKQNMTIQTYHIPFVPHNGAKRWFTLLESSTSRTVGLTVEQSYLRKQTHLKTQTEIDGLQCCDRIIREIPIQNHQNNQASCMLSSTV